ncbi:Sulfurtransferase TusE [Thiorhodovibrio litoralis]|nr:TusE/DsrC/DsvC family sulfur relay protein [Thiorhodovibrio winogradskyi]WPL13476.1 Sulfurtransferase TusE [Thiorhodovibrio litoralis]
MPGNASSRRQQSFPKPSQHPIQRKAAPAGVAVRGRVVPTDEQGYLRNPADWSEDYACAVAEQEGLRLTPRHWAVIRYLRDYVTEHSVPVSCADLDTILHFRACWPRACGQPRWLPGLFPAGGLRKQGHRLAGLPRGDRRAGCRLDV